MSLLYAIVLKGTLLMTYKNNYLMTTQLAKALVQTPSSAMQGDTRAKKGALVARQKAKDNNEYGFSTEEIAQLTSSSPVLNSIYNIQKAFAARDAIKVASSENIISDGDYTDTELGKNIRTSDDIGIDIIKGLMAKGYSPEIAAAFVGNMQHESGNFEYIQERGVPKGQGGYGHGQWTATRRKDFEDFISKNNLSPESAEASIEFIHHELQGNEKRIMSRIKNKNDVGELADVIAKKYFRPKLEENGGNPQYDKRVENSVNYLDFLQSQPNFNKGDPYEDYYSSKREGNR